MFYIARKRDHLHNKYKVLSVDFSDYRSMTTGKIERTTKFLIYKDSAFVWVYADDYYLVEEIQDAGYSNSWDVCF